MDNFIHCFEQPGPDDFILRSCLNIAARDWLEQTIMLDCTVLLQPLTAISLIGVLKLTGDGRRNLFKTDMSLKNYECVFQF
jgi:hypothetical protein